MAKVVFCQRVVYSFFSVMAISAVLKRRGHTVELVMEADSEKAAAEMLSLGADVAAFSTLVATGEFEWAAGVAGKLKRADPGIVTVFGSMHPTLFPEETMQNPAVDVLCRGEGEFAMLDLCERIDAGKSFTDVEGLWVRAPGGVARNAVRPPVENLDELPFPDRELYRKYGYFDALRSIDVLAGRACPFECSYCYNHILKGIYPAGSRRVRKHGVDRVLAELRDIKEKYRPKSFTFVDELFTVDRKWLRDFAARYPEEIGLPFICNIRADTADEETVELLASAGAFRVCFGLETGNERLRFDLLNKRITNRQLIDVAERLHRHGIKFLTANMLGLPGETVENAFETVELNHRMKTDYLYFSVFQPYPELKITEAAEKAGLVPHLEPSLFDSTYFRDSLLRQPDIRQLVNLHKLFYPAVRLYRLRKFFKLLIRLPANAVFDLIFVLSFGWMQFTCFKRDPRQLLAMGLGNLKVFLSKRA